MYDLWPPADYPNLTAPTPTVTGCTRNSTVSGLSTFTAQTPAVDAVTTRLIRPIFVKGQGGVLRWSVTVANITGNLLTDNQASGTDTSSNTTGFAAQGGGGTLSSSTTYAAQGSRSLKCAVSGAAFQGVLIQNAVAFAGVPMTWRASVRVTTTGTYRWGAYSATASVNTLETGTVTAGSWVTLSHTFTPVSDATDMDLVLLDTTSGGGITGDIYIDKIGLWRGTSDGEQWAMPGGPVEGVTDPSSLTAQAQVIFLDDDDAQVGRWSGPSWTVTDSIVLSARQDVPRRATQTQLKVLTTHNTNAGQWTEYDSRLEQVPADDPYTPPPVDAAFGDMSPEGVAPPAPPAGLPGFEANSPARRSPQVRWCQLHDSVRPDLTPKKNAREV